MTAAAVSASTVVAQDKPSDSSGAESTKIYREITPDGRVVYTDKARKGARIDHTITVEPAIKGNLWTTEAGARPVVPPRAERTPVQRVASIPVPGKRKTYDEATSDVIRAEMLLEDARKRQQAGVEPLPGERTGNVNGTSRLNEAYFRRQQALAEDVAAAEEALKKAAAERNALR